MRFDSRWTCWALGAVLGCAADSAAPSSHERFDPPALYRAWFEQTESCSGIGGDFDRLRFYRVPGDEFSCPSGMCVGHWTDSHEIFVAEAFLEDELVLRHEMLHDLIGHPGHPDPPFGPAGCGLTWTSWSGRLAGKPID
ncbi:MAG TPA: hypothetical protein VHJ69_01290 [Gemmatimonadales bacterium]|jgi:hypothetical protein|nr:hypothetical protein [Gemmatimonadales bacterium]